MDKLFPRDNCPYSFGNGVILKYLFPRELFILHSNVSKKLVCMLLTNGVNVIRNFNDILSQTEKKERKK